MKTLVLGGYGHFGARICRALAAEPAIELRVAGRDAQRAQAFAASLGGGARGMAMDLGAPDLAAALRAADVALLIHAAGPYQAQSYRVAQAAAEAGAHYLDLADGRRFVCDFGPALHQRFVAAGRSGFSGASTVPALSSAVVDHLCQGWRRVDSIDTVIAPAQTAPRGRATLEAVLGYCGRPIQVWSQGRWQRRLGWAQPAMVSFARLPPRKAALCDIPDLELFVQRYGVTDRVTFGAALEVGLAQQALALMAAARATARAVGAELPLERLAGLLDRSATWLDALGSSRGGMVVRVAGADANGLAIRRAWHLLAPDAHGPEVPCMAAILLARRLARAAPGATEPPGASACMGVLTLAEFEPEFERWGMQAEVVDEEPGDAAPQA